MRVHRWSTREGNRGVRAFARAYDPHERTLAAGSIEAYIASGARHSGIALSTDDEDGGLQLFAGLSHVACGWVTVGSPTFQTWLYKRWGRSLPEVNVVELRFHDRAVWWELWHDKWGWSSSTPKWRHGSFHWWRWLVGKAEHSSETINAVRRVVVPMPEGSYDAEVTIEKHTWKSPRWPWSQSTYSYDLNVLSRPHADGPYLPDDDKSGYIPVPGKGENSWDCGGDGIFSQSGPGRTVEEAIGNVVASALRDRMRHAGRHDYAEPIS